MLPVINENDTTATDEISFGDNDFLAAQVAVLVGADELILLTDIDGLYTADPRLHPDARIVREVEDFAALEELEIGHTTSPLGSGGMRSKVVAADMATAAGIATVICNGLRAEALAAVLAGEREGTRFAAREARYSSFKLWLKYAKPSRGTLRDRRGRRARGARGQREPAAGRRRRGARRVRRGRRGRDRPARAATATLRTRSARGSATTRREELRQVLGMKSARRARGAAARHRGGRAPRLPRGRLTTAARPYPLGPWPPSSSSVADDLPRGQARVAHARARSTAPSRTPRSRRSRPRCESAARRSSQANERDMQAGREAEIGDALLDRLRLDEPRDRRDRRARCGRSPRCADPVGEVIDGRRLPNGLDVRKVRVPLGVVAVVYEARPNVTIDAAALCLKSGNAIVLRGSSSAAHSNAALAQIAAEAAVAAGLPEGCVSLVAGGGREELAELATQRDSVDLIIPRGGEGLKEALQAVATVPVIYAASGNCHVYVDATADLDQAEAIVLNAKTQRPGVCNAAETLLVHGDVAPRSSRGSCAR